MLGRNIRNEQRRANKKPANVPACEEVVLGGSLSPRKIHADAKHDREVDPDDHEIQRGYTLMSNRDLRCKQHPFLLGIRRIPSAESMAQMIYLSRECSAT